MGREKGTGTSCRMEPQAHHGSAPRLFSTQNRSWRESSIALTFDKLRCLSAPSRAHTYAPRPPARTHARWERCGAVLTHHPHVRSATASRRATSLSSASSGESKRARTNYADATTQRGLLKGHDGTSQNVQKAIDRLQIPQHRIRISCYNIERCCAALHYRRTQMHSNFPLTCCVHPIPA